MPKTIAEKIAYLQSSTDVEILELARNHPNIIREVAIAADKLLTAGKPFAKKCEKWEASHVPTGICPYRDTTQITHKLGDFRIMRREILNIIDGVVFT